MQDERLVEMFWSRDESAIRETEKKYGKLCHYIAENFLSSREDREECVNDAMLAMWNNIPPERPQNFYAYLMGTVRRLALHRSRDNNAWKRGGQVQTVCEELLSMLEDGTDLARDYEAKRAGEIINRFLEKSDKKQRQVFVMRYYMDESIARISARTGYSETNVKVILNRMRRKLAKELEREGITEWTTH